MNQVKQNIYFSNEICVVINQHLVLLIPNTNQKHNIKIYLKFKRSPGKTDTKNNFLAI